MLTHNLIRQHILALTKARDKFDLFMAEQYTPYRTDQEAETLKQPGLLQMFQLTTDEERHMAMLIDHLELVQTAHVLDLGCGTGRLAEWLQTHRPDLRVTLLNRSLAQLSCCRPTRDRVAGDMQILPFRDDSVNATILAYSLGYGLVDDVLAESTRVLKPGGQILLYDLVCRQGPANYMLVTLGYKVYDWARLLQVAHRVGLTLIELGGVTTQHIHPAFLKLPAWLLGALLREIAPICAVFRKTSHDR